MKSITFFLFVALLYSYRVTSQSSSQNFIKKTTPVSPVTTETSLNALGSSFKVEGINYLDGLGRPIQDVLVKASPLSRDIVQPYVYDQYGRQSISFLPYTDANAPGTYRSSFITPLTDFYTNQSMVGKTAYPYSEAVFDNSPLNIIKETSAPDADWQLGNGHTSQLALSFNSDPNDDPVMLWELQVNGDYATNDHYYPQNSLYTSKTTDPNGNYSITYKDKNGKTICVKKFLETRSFNGNPYPYYLSTYLIYDDLGQLILVIPPKAIELMDVSQNYSVNSITEDLVYRYVYDQRHRLVEKKAPGMGWQYFVYNQLNQPALYRDANLSAQNKWSFIKYDILGRPILSGLMNASGLPSFQNRILAQAAFDASQTVLGESEIYENLSYPFGYTNSTLPNQNLDILTVNYYDDYDFNNDGTVDGSFNSSPVPCIVFNIATLASLNNKMQTSVTTGTSMNGSLNSAIGMSTGQMASRLNYCLSQLNTLQSIMENNAAKSYSLTLSDNETMLASLNTSLQEQATPLIKNIGDTIAMCKRNDPKTSTDFTNRLNEVISYAQSLSNKTSTSFPLIATVQAGCQPYVNTATARTRGFVTGSKIKVLDASNSVQWENTIVFYDEEGQAIQAQSNDHMGGTDLVNLIYDFTGNVIHSQQVRTLSGQPTIQVLNHMSFDKMGRLLRVDQKNNADQPVVLSTYNYNELSQLIDKKVHSLTNATSFLQSMDFRYNVQGWLTSINNISLANDMGTNPTTGTNDDLDDLWGMELSYNTPTLGGTPQYNGNISEKKWRSADYVKRSYKYEYDKLDRLKSSSYSEFSSFTGWSVNIGKYDEKDITYDANGNIKTLKRYGFQTNSSGFGLIDNLSYQYSGNLLGAVTDASTSHGMADFKDNGSTGNNEYSYDGNGNLTANANKGIVNISYNHMNLPVQITFGNGNKIEYLYDAVGKRLNKKVTQNNSAILKKYSGIYEYNASGQLETMHTSEGRCVTTGSLPAFRYEYQYTDNTGNVMMAFSDMDLNNSIDPNTEVIQQNHFYGYGMRMEGTNAPFVGVENKYKFSGKELDDELGLNEYDFGARFYDPVIGRWACIDPMADFEPNLTPFRYGYNNPINVTDPTGMLELSDQVGGGFDYNASTTYTGTPRYVYKNVDGKMVGDWEGGSPTAKTDTKKEGTAKEGEARTGAKERGGSGGSNSTANSGSSGMSFNGMGNGGSYDGSYLKSSYDYDYRGNGESFQKMKDDIKYITFGVMENSAGPGGRMVDILIRDWNAEGNRENVEALDDAMTAVFPLLSIRNGHLAGRIHPITGVPFDKKGFPDFSKYLYKKGPHTVKIKPTGSRSGDFAAANKAAGYASTPKGYTWHHHQSKGKMQLVETKIHSKTGHTGGFHLW